MSEPKLCVFGTPVIPPQAKLAWEPAEDGGPCPGFAFKGGHAHLYPNYPCREKCDNGCDSEGMLYGGVCAKCGGKGYVQTFGVLRCRVNVWIHGESNWSGDFEAFGSLEEMEKFVQDVQQLLGRFPATAKPEESPY